jgi:hypothetical protein
MAIVGFTTLFSYNCGSLNKSALTLTHEYLSKFDPTIIGWFILKIDKSPSVVPAPQVFNFDNPNGKNILYIIIHLLNK